MGRTKQKPITVIELSRFSTGTSNPTPASQTPSQPTPALRDIPPQRPNADANFDDASGDVSEQQTEPTPPADHSTPIPPTEPLVRCPVCNDTFSSSHREQFREHVESCAANGLGNESDEDSAALSTPPQSDSSPANRLPSAYSKEVETYPTIHEDDVDVDDAQPRFRLAKLTDISEFEEALAEAEEGTKEDHLRALTNMYDALTEYQDEWLELDKTIKTSRYPNTISIEEENERDRVRGGRGFNRDNIKPTQRVINPRAKPVRPDDPEKWFYTNQFQLDQDKTEGAVYGYIVKESARDIGHQDPIGQRPRGPGQNRDLRVRAPPRNTVGDGDSGDESGLNAVDDALMEGGRGKREKRPSNRVMGTNSRASSADAKPAKPARKNAKSRLAELEADPSAADTLDSTQRWANDVDAAADRQPGEDSESSDDEAGVAKPHKGPKSSYLDKTKKAARKGKNAAVDSVNGELDDDEAAAAARARSQKRSEGAKMGWAKRKEALAAKESSTQASINGDDDEGNRSEIAKQEPNDASDANSALKTAPKKKAKQMMQLADGTWIEKPSAATINMRRRWQKKREAEAKGLPPPKIGRYKKTDVPNVAESSTPADFNEQQNNEVLAAVDRAANNKRKQSGREDDEQNDDDDQQDADKKGGKVKRRKKNQELSDAIILDDDTLNDNTLELEDDDHFAAQSHNKQGKRTASEELGGPPNQRRKMSPRNPESLASSDEEDEATEFEDLADTSSSLRKRTKSGGRAKSTKTNKKGTHTKKLDAVKFQPILRTGPKLGSFIRHAGAAGRAGLIVGFASISHRNEPNGGDEGPGDNVSDDEPENGTTEEDEPLLPRFLTVPSGISHTDPRASGNPSSAKSSDVRRASFVGDFTFSARLNPMPMDPGRPLSMKGNSMPEDFETGARKLRSMDPFQVPWTQDNPHPPVYLSRSSNADIRVPRPTGRNDVVAKQPRLKTPRSGPARKSVPYNPVDKSASKQAEAPRTSEDSGPRRSNLPRKAPVKRNFVDSNDIFEVQSSSPPGLPNRPPPRPSRTRNPHGQFSGMSTGYESDDNHPFANHDPMRGPGQAAPANDCGDLDGYSNNGARNIAYGQGQGPVTTERNRYTLSGEDDDRDANLRIALEASRIARIACDDESGPRESS